MAYRRRRSYRRGQKPVYTWQRIFTAQPRKTLPAGYTSWKIGNFYPGVNDVDSAGNYDTKPFDSPSTLMRIRGQIVHAGVGGSGTNSNSVVPVCVAMFAVPAELTTDLSDGDMPNLFLNADGDDYPLYLSEMCDVGQRINPEHDVDIKAKRRLEVGAGLIISASGYVPSGLAGTPAVDVGFNLSFLWKRG